MEWQCFVVFQVGLQEGGLISKVLP